MRISVLLVSMLPGAAFLPPRPCDSVPFQETPPSRSGLRTGPGPGGTPLASGIAVAPNQAVTVLLASGVSFAQEAGRLQFEAASVKPTAIDHLRFVQLARSGRLRGGVRVAGSRAEYTYMTLRQLVAEAYQVRSAQVVGPDWIGGDRFDLVCRMPEGSRKEDAPQMLRFLLADRFKVVAHREPRTLDVMALLVGRNGPKLKESAPEPASAEEWEAEAAKGAAQIAAKGGRDSASFTMGSIAVRFSIDNSNSLVHLELNRMRMADLADLLTRFPVAGDRLVVDQTGLEGKYDAVLDAALSELTGAMREADSSAAQNPAEAASTPGGDMLRSLRGLGLELEKRKASVEHVIVERAERAPTGN